MKMKKLTSIALAAALAIGTFGFSVPANATEPLVTTTTDYVITIPATLNVANAGWNATDGIKAQVKSGDTFDSSKKLTVTAESKNNWALKSGDNSVGYNLATATGTYSSTAEPASWAFSAVELNETSGTNKAMGIIVEDYSSMPAGTYQDTVTFTAKVKNAVTTKTVTFNTDTDGKTINKDGVTCSRGFDTYNNLFGNSSGFSVSSGQFTKIEVTADDVSMIGMDQETMNTIEGWSTTRGTATWTGKSSTVPFGVIMGNSGSVTIVFTIEE